MWHLAKIVRLVSTLGAVSVGENEALCHLPHFGHAKNFVLGMSGGKHWVLLVASSKGWKDYRDQANVCHAYQVMRQNGIPDEQIVVMMYDDIAYNKKNPDPGKIINVPNGPDVYTGVPKDYTGEDVSAGNFLAVLRGDSSAVKKTGPKKVIQSGRNDTVFIYLSDHGLQGSLNFTNSTLHAADLTDTVKTMARNGKFSKMVIYIEACHSGSMLDQLKDSNVYGVSACRPEEKSYSCYYDKRLNTSISTLFSAYWLQHTEMAKRNTTSFGEQFSYLKKKVSETKRQNGDTQTPCNYGDMNICNLMLSEFLGESRDSSQTQERQYDDLKRSQDQPAVCVLA
ncbi:legumain-like [Hemibagrus wyckioides]|uniref:legumain-like n=1 Tax=Hemibagrus wyckioides TaxID=337641 RepID=UPI00266DAD2D|nr:legumain-like [Hemibagrus wyckioides]